MLRLTTKRKENIMAIKQTMQVLGAKGNKGEFEGTKFDYTKMRVVMDVSDRNGTEVGFNVSEIVFGLSDNFEKVKGYTYPLMCDLEISMTTRGYEIESCKPTAAAASRV
jgi:hypothetical protein